MLFPTITTVARSVDDVDLSDLTTAQRTGPATWTADGLDVPFDRDLSENEAAAVARRLMSTDAVEEQQRELLMAYLANPAPSTEDTVEQLRVLTTLALKLMDGPRIDVVP